MTERNLDQLLDAWLDLGPEKAPDRVAAAASYEARSTPQSRTPWWQLRRIGWTQRDIDKRRATWWSARRFPTMSNVTRIVVGATAVGVLAAIGIGLLYSRGEHNVGGPITTQDATVSPTDLGVFEPVRGRVVFRVGSHLGAVDPLDPSSSAVVEPGDLGLGTRAMPAGWSADGSKLAVSDEYNGDLYVMDHTGSLDRVPVEELPDLGFGCCSFVASAWLSPDGTEGLAFVPPGDRRVRPGRLYILDLDDIGRSRVVAVEQFEWAEGEFTQDPMPVWSPDGSQIAYVWSKGGDLDEPAVGILDLASGTSRELVSGPGLIRQLAWSPDGSQLLMVAGRDAPVYSRQLNPLVRPQPTSLYLIDIDHAETREIATGHYVAAAWSPNGAQIAAIDYPGKREVVVINADGSGGRLVLAVLHGSIQAGSDSYLFTGVVWHPVPASQSAP